MAMPFFLKDPRNRLKTTDEPEQLDLFGHPSHEPVPTIGHTISPSVGYKIACAAYSHHGLGAQYVSLIRNTIAHQSWANLSPEWHDYVVGLGSTMSFWPTSMHEVDPVGGTTPTGLLIGFSAAPISSLTTSGSA